MKKSNKKSTKKRGREGDKDDEVGEGEEGSSKGQR